MSAAEFYGELGIRVPDSEAPNVMIPCFASPDAHAHEDRNRSMSLHLETGQWRCHGCGITGNAYSAARMFGKDEKGAADLAKRFGLFKDTRPKYRMPTEPQLKRWREAFAENEPVRKRLWELKGWTREATRRCGLGWDGERVTFPVRQYRPGTKTAHNKCVGLLRYLPGGTPKMISWPGSKRLLFPAPMGDTDSTVFVVEGEPCAVSVRSCRHAAVSVPGSNGWRMEFAGQLARFKRVIVLPDCDDVGRRLAVQIADSIAQAEIVDIDHSRHDGYDVGDMVAEASRNGGVEQVGRWLAAL